MGLESGSFIATLVSSNPVGATDPKSQGDDHIRLIKKALQNSFPHISTTVEALPAELNLTVGATGGLATLSVSFADVNSKMTKLINGSLTVSALYATASVNAATISAVVVNATTINATTLSSTVLNATLVNATTLSTSVLNAVTVNATTLSSTVLNATRVNAATLSAAVVNSTLVNATTLSAAVVNAALVNTTTLSVSVIYSATPAVNTNSTRVATTEYVIDAGRSFRNETITNLSITTSLTPTQANQIFCIKTADIKVILPAIANCIDGDVYTFIGGFDATISGNASPENIYHHIATGVASSGLSKSFYGGQVFRVVKDGTLWTVIQQAASDYSGVLAAGTDKGTFTPVVADAASGGNEGTAALASGVYTKIGRTVHAIINFVNINTTGMTAGNTVYITGLPFTSLAINTNARQWSQSNGTLSFEAYIPNNSNYLQTSIIVSDLSSGSSDMYFNLTYEVA